MSSTAIDKLAESAGVVWFDYQRDVLAALQGREAASLRACLYYRTGAGKTFTALAIVAQAGAQQAVAIAPPSTHDAWVEAGRRFGVTVEAMSHAKFRQKGTQLSRTKAVIADEFHLFGGHSGIGWKKFDRLAAGIKAPLVLASATPNYNDAERVYCIQHVLNPLSCRGGYLEFVYKHCETEVNPFGMMPKVSGFRHYTDAAEYLADLPDVFYVPDEVVYTIQDQTMVFSTPDSFESMGFDERRRRICASRIEKDHARVNLQLVDDEGLIDTAVMSWLQDKVQDSETPVLMYFTHSTIAEAAAVTAEAYGWRWGLITGKTPTRTKAEILQRFRRGEFDVLIGTASLATGTDGLDKVCDTLVIVDDTNDDSLRRQLIGRIMPRGADSDATSKQVHRLLPL